MNQQLMTDQQFNQLTQLQNMYNQGYQLTGQQQQQLAALTELYTYTQQVMASQQQQQGGMYLNAGNQNSYNNMGNQNMNTGMQQPMYGGTMNATVNNRTIHRQHMPTTNRYNAAGNQGGYVNTGNMGGSMFNATNMNKANVTSGNTFSDRFSDDKHETPNYINGGNSMQTKTAETYVAKEPEVKVKRIPIEGNEFPYLTLENQKCIKVDMADKYFSYKVVEKEDMVNFNEHASVYNNANLIVKANISKADDTQLKIFNREKPNVVYSVSDMVTDIEYMINESEINYSNIAMEFIVVDTYMINRVTTDATDDIFADMVLKSKDLIELAEHIKSMVNVNRKLTSKAFNKINDTLTKMVNVTFRASIGSGITVDDFIYDIADLKDLFDKMNDVRSKGIRNAVLSDIFTALTVGANDVKNLEHEDNKVGVKVGPMYYATRKTLIYTSDEDIKYELLDVSKGLVKYIRSELTPLIDDLVTTIADEAKFDRSNQMILMSDEGKRYRIYKTKLNASYTIEEA